MACTHQQGARTYPRLWLPTQTSRICWLTHLVYGVLRDLVPGSFTGDRVHMNILDIQSLAKCSLVLQSFRVSDSGPETVPEKAYVS